MRDNNFDFFRLLFAIFVIVTHSYPLTGVPEWDWLMQITNGQFSFSSVGVSGFFVLSGYLIFQSLERSNSLKNYFWKRILRLYPALIFILGLTVLLAPFVYKHSLFYLFNESVITYIPKNLTLFNMQFHIHGVFTDNPYPKAINGSLWTLSYEFLMYTVISLLFFIKKKTLKFGILVFVICSFLIALFFYANQTQNINFLYYINLHKILDLGTYFLIGSLFALTGIEKIKSRSIVILLAFLILILTVYFNIAIFSKYFLLPVIFILASISSTKYIKNLSKKFGDLSYGMYIYAFPIQQTLMYYFTDFNYIQLMIFTVITTIPFALFSWHIIEKRALRYKNFRLFK